MSRIINLDSVYNYNPVPKCLSVEEKKYIIGVEACLWSEQIPNDSNAMIKLLPRLSALSEIAWLPASKKDFKDFKERLLTQFDRYDAKGWPYYISTPGGFGDNIFYKDNTTCSITSEIPGVEIRYTTDGSEPAANSALYKNPIPVNEKW